MKLKLTFGYFIISMIFFSCAGEATSTSDESNKQTQEIAPEKKVRVIEDENSLVNKVIIVADPYEFKERIEEGDVQLVDVRTPDEFNSGHIGDALNIDYLEPGFEERMSRLDKEQVLYIYCQSGNRSGKASLVLKKLGFNKIYDLEGGYGKWEELGL